MLIDYKAYSFNFQIPLGVILAIVDLALIVVSKSAPALIAGKSIMLKPLTQVFIYIFDSKNTLKLFL